MYRPLSEWPIPIIDRDTDPYRFRLSTKFTDMPTLLLRSSRWRGAASPAHWRTRWAMTQPSLLVGKRVFGTCWPTCQTRASVEQPGPLLPWIFGVRGSFRGAAVNQSYIVHGARPAREWSQPTSRTRQEAALSKFHKEGGAPPVGHLAASSRVEAARWPTPWCSPETGKEAGVWLSAVLIAGSLERRGQHLCFCVSCRWRSRANLPCDALARWRHCTAVRLRHLCTAPPCGRLHVSPSSWLQISLTKTLHGDSPEAPSVSLAPHAHFPALHCGGRTYRWGQG